MIKIAKVLKPHGLKGEIKIDCFIKDVSFWKKLGHVFIDGSKFNIKHVRFYKDFGYLILDNVSSITNAEKFRNKTLEVEREQIENKENEYLISDLEDCDVFDEKGDFVGQVISIEKYGAADIINIEKMGAKRSFPFLKEVIKNVDINEKKVIVFRDKINEVLIWI